MPRTIPLGEVLRFAAVLFFLGVSVGDALAQSGVPYVVPAALWIQWGLVFWSLVRPRSRKAEL